MFENVWALIIEDEAHSLIAIASILNELEIRYKRNTTGHEAAHQARTMHPRPDFILLDMSLPENDPYHILRSFKSDSALAHLPVIAIDHSPTLRAVHEMKKAGFDGFIAKPLPRKLFPNILHDALTQGSLWHKLNS